MKPRALLLAGALLACSGCDTITGWLTEPAVMVKLPGGTFAMADRKDTVTVAPFSLDMTEVTVDAFTTCVKSGKCTMDHPGQWTKDGKEWLDGPACNYTAKDRGSHPMNCVDWHQAEAYCQAQGKRLPTEEEFEWAARGGAEGRTYPWGNTPPEAQLCWSGAEKRATTCAVGSFPQGDAPGHLHDLSGNVWEWTSTEVPVSDPSNWDHTPGARVLRGGGWMKEDGTRERAGARGAYTPSFRDSTFGFRCAS